MHVDASRATLVRRIAGIYGITASFNQGLYDLRTSSDVTSVRLAEIGGGQGGTHEVFWAMFVDRLKDVEAGVLRSSLREEEAQKVFVSLSSMRSSLIRNSLHGNWLSSIRNVVQYRHGMRVWQPVKVSKVQRQRLSRLARSWMGDPLDLDVAKHSDSELSHFVAACTYIVGMARVILVRIGERCTSGRSFVHFAPLLRIALAP
jgi:hypothetical protein